MTIFSKLGPVAATAYGFQALAGSIFVPLAEDKFFDISGTLGFFTTTFVSLYYRSLKAKFIDGLPIELPGLSGFASRQLFLSAALGLWGVRLGSFLFLRALEAGGDSRFDVIKHNPRRFSFSWFAQATWTFLVGLPVYMANVLPAPLHAPLTYKDYAAVGLFTVSFLFEIVADRQKTAWKQEKENKQHDEKFISRGLWSISRHPNYVGEIGIWAGIAALSVGSLQSSYFPMYTPFLAALSPLTTWALITKLSGVPPLERAGDKKFGNDPKYQQYKKSVPVMWPFIGGYTS